MNNISLYIENIYEGIPINSDSKFIFDHKNIYKESLIKDSSRYKLNGLNYSPYKLSLDKCNLLFKNILVIPRLTDELDNHLVLSNEDKIVIHEYSKLDNLLYNGDFTTNGLLAVRLSRCYGDLEFKDKVNSAISKFMISYDVDGCVYFIPNNIYLILMKYNDPELSKLIINKFGFKWRD